MKMANELQSATAETITMLQVDSAKLAEQGEIIKSIDDLNEATFMQVKKAELTITKIRMQAFTEKLIMWSIAAFLTLINVYLLFKNLVD